MLAELPGFTAEQRDAFILADPVLNDGMPIHTGHTPENDPVGNVTSTPITEEEYAQILARARNEPGVASGAGKQVGSDWLREGIRAGAMPIPASVAEKLEGRRFGSFDSDRRAFWKAVAAEPELLGQFDEFAQNAIRKGLAPSAPKAVRVGQRDRLELDHILPLWKEGKLYGADNIQIMPPKSHIEKTRADMKETSMNDYMKEKSISEFTKQEFLDFVQFLGTAPGNTEAENSRWNRKFEELAEHPSGTDLLFYPEPSKKAPEAMVEEVERYRRENGLPGFKDSDF